MVEEQHGWPPLLYPTEVLCPPLLNRRDADQPALVHRVMNVREYPEQEQVHPVLWDVHAPPHGLLPHAPAEQHDDPTVPQEQPPQLQHGCGERDQEQELEHPPPSPLMNQNPDPAASG